MIRSDAPRGRGEPEDARRGWLAPTPADADEAALDRAMADAERAVVLGTATDEQRDMVDRTGAARSHEQRRDASRDDG
jgi:hypothetical protein